MSPAQASDTENSPMESFGTDVAINIGLVFDAISGSPSKGPSKSPSKDTILTKSNTNEPTPVGKDITIAPVPVQAPTTAPTEVAIASTAPPAQKAATPTAAAGKNEVAEQTQTLSKQSGSLVRNLAALILLTAVTVCGVLGAIAFAHHAPGSKVAGGCTCMCAWKWVYVYVCVCMCVRMCVYMCVCDVPTAECRAVTPMCSPMLLLYVWVWCFSHVGLGVFVGLGPVGLFL